MSAGSEAKPSARDWRQFEMGAIIMCGWCARYYRVEDVQEKSECPGCTSTERAGYEYTHVTDDGFIALSPAMLDQLMGAANRGR